MTQHSKLMAMKVRRGSSTDMDWLVEQLRQFADFFGSKKSLFADEAYVRSQLEVFMNSHLVLVAEREDLGRIGFIAGFVTPHMFNPAIKVLAEMFWWVDPLKRNTRAGLMLLEEFIAWGKSNVDWITFTLESKSPVNDRLLYKRGFKLQERSFILEVS